MRSSETISPFVVQFAFRRCYIHLRWRFSREENVCGGGSRLEDTDSEEDILDYLEEEAEDVTDSDEDIRDGYS